MREIGFYSRDLAFLTNNIDFCGMRAEQARISQVCESQDPGKAGQFTIIMNAADLTHAYHGSSSARLQ